MSVRRTNTRFAEAALMPQSQAPTLTVLRLKVFLLAKSTTINHMGVLQQCTRFDLEDASRVECNCGLFHDTTGVPIQVP